MKKFYIFLLTLVAVNGTVAQWFPQNSGTSKRLLSVCFPVEDTGYVVGHAAESGRNGIILKTTDGGINWITQMENDSLGFHSVFFTDANTGYVTGGKVEYPDYPAVILKTTDGGATWNIVFIYTSVPGAANNIGEIFFPSTNTGYALGTTSTSHGSYNSKIVKTENAGANWTVDYSLGAYKLKSIFFTSIDIGFAVGQDSRYYYNWLILKTTNGGIDWTATIDSSWCDYDLWSVHFPDSNTGYAVGRGYDCDSVLILKTTNGGINWTKQLWLANYSLKSVYFINADIGFVVGSNGTILKTINGGNDWSEQVSGTNNWLHSVKFTDSETGYIVGNNGTILKTTNGGGPPVGINDMYQTTDNLTIYPNPTSNSFAIETQTNGSLTIHNISGHQLLQQEITEPTTEIDVSKLKSGIYILKVISTKGVQVGKMIKQ